MTAQGTALVTGASAGIGRELARTFASEGHDVVLVARREAELRRIGDNLADEFGVETHYVALDLSERENRAALAETVDERDLEVEFLVNNVGIGTQGHFCETDLGRELDQVALNVTTPTHLTKLFAPAMRGRGRGGVLNVASTAAFQPGPYMAVYYASKAYVLSLSQALHEELRQEGVTVTALCPGPVDTEFQDRADMTDTRLGGGSDLVSFQSVDAVARAGYDGLMDGEAVVIPGLDYKLLAALTKVTPRSLQRKLAGRLNR